MSELKRPEPVFFHFRIKNPDGGIAAKGGATVVFHPTEKKFGVALCCPKDRFCKRTGAKIALHRSQLEPNAGYRNGRRFAYAYTYAESNEYEDVKFKAKTIVWAAASGAGNQDLAEILKTS